ncbi:MAG: ATP-dependent Clp protease adaptor ClpS [Deltaproteobacteria bacterium]|nr:ATP-dependent Clp protease adaptor ClpS [Deltaproteobacteria bacterium]
MSPKDRCDRPEGGLAREEEAGVATESDVRPQRPRRYRVLLHNDDYTTMDFVVMVLMEIFHHDELRAVEIMLHVHRRGVGVAGVYPFGIAETRVRKVHELAREHEFPLRCSMEPE